MKAPTNKASLILLPNLLGPFPSFTPFLPPIVFEAVATLDGLICESEQAGRRYLGQFETKKPAREIPIAVYNKNSSDEDFLLEPIKAGERWGLISDAGLPCIADPGYKLVARARACGIAIEAFSGPSSLLMALMLSGLPGQHFCFHGYLPKEIEERSRTLEKIEKKSLSEASTQIFIEAPHRNQHLLQAAIESLNPATLLCVAWNLTLPSQNVMCQSIGHWKKMAPPSIEKKPAVFLLFASQETQEKEPSNERMRRSLKSR